MEDSERLNLRMGSLRSLSWQGDKLVDWLSGNRIGLDGAVEERIGPRFEGYDRVLTALDGRLLLVFQNDGRSGLLVKDGEVLREVERTRPGYTASRPLGSATQQHWVYTPTTETFMRYQATLGEGPGAPPLLAHSPVDDGMIDVEDSLAGHSIGGWPISIGDDYVDRLEFSPGASRLIATCFMWHPVYYTDIYDTRTAKRIDHLSTGIARFVREDTVAFVPDEGDPNRLIVKEVGVADSSRELKLEQWWQEILPFGENALAMGTKIGVLSLESGNLGPVWEDLAISDPPSSAKEMAGDPVRFFAVDSMKKRFAVSADDVITVVQL